MINDVYSRISSDEYFRKILGLASKALFIKFSSGVLTFLMFLVVARVLSAGQFGIFGIGFSLALFMSVLSGFGLGTLVMRLWPEYSVKASLYVADQAVMWGFKKTCLFSIVLSGIIIFVFIIFKFSNDYDFLFGLSVAALSISMSVSEFVSAALRAQKRLTLALVPKDIFWRFFLILIGGVIVYKDVSVDAFHMLNICAILLALITVIQIHLSGLKNIINKKLTLGGEYVSEWVELARPIWFGGVVFALAMHADMLLVGFFLEAEVVASYFAALKISSIFALPIMAINQLSGPMISEYYHAGRFGLLQKNLRLYLFFCLLIIIPLLLIVILYGRELLSLFNPDFSDSYYILLILSIGYLFHCLTGPASILLQMTGRSKLALKTSLCTQGVSFVFFPIVVSLFGVFGIAVLKMFEMAVRNSIQSIQGVRIFGLNTSIVSFFNVKKSN